MPLQLPAEPIWYASGSTCYIFPLQGLSHGLAMRRAFLNKELSALLELADLAKGHSPQSVLLGPLYLSSFWLAPSCLTWMAQPLQPSGPTVRSVMTPVTSPPLPASQPPSPSVLPEWGLFYLWSWEVHWCRGFPCLHQHLHPHSYL